MFVMDSASLRIVPEQTCGDNHFREMVDGIWEKVGMWTELVSFFVFHFTSPLLLVLSLSFTSMFPSPIFVQCLECWFHHWFCFVSPSFSAEDPGVHGLISLRYCLRTGAGRSDHQILEPFIFRLCCVSTAGQVCTLCIPRMPRWVAPIIDKVRAEQGWGRYRTFARVVATSILQQRRESMALTTKLAV